MIPRMLIARVCVKCFLVTLSVNTTHVLKHLQHICATENRVWNSVVRKLHRVAMKAKSQSILKLCCQAVIMSLVYSM